YIKGAVEKNKLIEHSSWLSEVLKSYITINYVFNESQTNKVEQIALSNISTTRGMVQKDELIAEEGKIINNEAYQKLESLRKVFEDESRISGEQNLVTFGHFILISLAMGLMMVFLYFFRKDIFNNNRLLFIIFLVILVMLGVLSWAIKLKIPSLYYIPYCSVPIIFRLLFDTRIALNIHILMVLIAGLFVSNSFDFVFLQFTAGMVAIYSIKTLV